MKSFPLFSLIKESSCSDSTAYELRLKEDALESLRRIKREKGSKADMWCHFGKVVIRGSDEGKLTEYNLLQKNYYSSLFLRVLTHQFEIIHST